MAANIFFSYSHKDEALRDQVEVQLSMLKRQSIIETWHDRRIGAGEEINYTIEKHVESADIILLLISADFIASNYCYEIEMERAMQRHQDGEAVVIPVILRACDWHGAPFGKLNATPPDGKPITQYPDRDQAFLEVAKAIRGAVSRLGTGTKATQSTAIPSVSVPQSPQPHVTIGPRSSNLSIAKTFTDRDKDHFRRESFEYITRFFENSLNELIVRNPQIEGNFRCIDSDRFTSVVYKQGKVVSQCTVFLGNRSTFANGIIYSVGENSASNSINELLSVEADNQSMFLRSMGIFAIGNEQNVPKLTQEGAAELYWGKFMSPLRIS